MVGIYISKGIYKRTDRFRHLTIFLNIFLIYTSANGIQAGHAFFETSQAGPKTEQLALFGWLDARPWLPDATSKKMIHDLRVTTEQLSIENDSLKQLAMGDRYNEEIKKLKEEINRLNARNQSLSDSLKLAHSRLADFEQTRSQWKEKLNTDTNFYKQVTIFKSRMVDPRFYPGYFEKLTGTSLSR